MKTQNIIKGYYGIMDLDVTNIDPKFRADAIRQHYEDIKNYKFFGEFGVKKTEEEFVKEFLGEIPINPVVGKIGDEG